MAKLRSACKLPVKFSGFSAKGPRKSEHFPLFTNFGRYLPNGKTF